MQADQIGRFFVYAWTEKGKGSEGWLGHWLISAEDHGGHWHPPSDEGRVCEEVCATARTAELHAYMEALGFLKGRTRTVCEHPAELPYWV